MTNKILPSFGFVILLASVVFTQASTSSAPTDPSALRITSLKFAEANINRVLSQIANRFDVPIGLEVSPREDVQSEERSITIDISEGTLGDVLDAIVRKNDLYDWRVVNGVINVFPKPEHRDDLLGSLLDTAISRIDIDRNASRYMVRKTLVESKEIQSALHSNRIKAELETFGSYDFSRSGGETPLHLSETTLLDALNHIIKESRSRYWIVDRYGDNREYLLLNLS